MEQVFGLVVVRTNAALLPGAALLDGAGLDVKAKGREFNALLTGGELRLYDPLIERAAVETKAVRRLSTGAAQTAKEVTADNPELLKLAIPALKLLVEKVERDEEGRPRIEWAKQWLILDSPCGEAGARAMWMEKLLAAQGQKAPTGAISPRVAGMGGGTSPRNSTKLEVPQTGAGGGRVSPRNSTKLEVPGTQPRDMTCVEIVDAGPTLCRAAPSGAEVTYMFKRKWFSSDKDCKVFVASKEMLAMEAAAPEPTGESAETDDKKKGKKKSSSKDKKSSSKKDEEGEPVMKIKNADAALLKGQLTKSVVLSSIASGKVLATASEKQLSLIRGYDVYTADDAEISQLLPWYKSLSHKEDKGLTHSAYVSRPWVDMNLPTTDFRFLRVTGSFHVFPDLQAECTGKDILSGSYNICAYDSTDLVGRGAVLARVRTSRIFPSKLSLTILPTCAIPHNVLVMFVLLTDKLMTEDPSKLTGAGAVQYAGATLTKGVPGGGLLLKGLGVKK
jgi:hypothetical protein